MIELINAIFLVPVVHIHQAATGGRARLLGLIKCFCFRSNVVTERSKSGGALQKAQMETVKDLHLCGSPEAALTYQLAPRVGLILGAATGPDGGLLLADVAVGHLTGVVCPAGVLHEGLQR